MRRFFSDFARFYRGAREDAFFPAGRVVAFFWTVRWFRWTRRQEAAGWPTPSVD